MGKNGLMVCDSTNAPLETERSCLSSIDLPLSPKTIYTGCVVGLNEAGRSNPITIIEEMETELIE
jgi:hypothetical protein